MLKVLKQIASHFFCYKCIYCSVEISKPLPLCFSCQKEMGLVNQSSICRKCGRYCLTEICTFCIHAPNIFEKARTYCVYSEISSSVIKQFKYYNNSICKKFIIKKISFVYNTHFLKENIEIITSVPMNSFKEWWKGYNHSQKISQEIAKTFDLKHINLLKKSFTLKRQALLNKEKRLTNVKNTISYKHNKRLEDKTVLLIDDTITTGSTVSECCKVLLQHGAKKVLVLTFAKSIADETNY